MDITDSSDEEVYYDRLMADEDLSDNSDDEDFDVGAEDVHNVRGEEDLPDDSDSDDEDFDPGAEDSEDSVDRVSILNNLSSNLSSKLSSLAQSMSTRADFFYCANPCEDLKYFPEQGGYGSCAIISTVSLVLKNPCLMDYLRIKNYDAYYALKMIKQKSDGSYIEGQVENKVCPLLPNNVWETYFTFYKNYGIEIDRPHSDPRVESMKEQLRIRRDNTRRQIFKDENLKRKMLNKFKSPFFLEALFGTGSIVNNFDHTIKIGNGHDDSFKINQFEISTRDLSKLKPIVLTLEFQQVGAFLFEYDITNLKVDVDFKNFIVNFYDRLALELEKIPEASVLNSLFDILPYFIVVGKNYVRNKNVLIPHAFLGKVCKKNEEVTLCSWGMCVTNSKTNENLPNEDVQKLFEYFAVYIHLVLVPKSEARLWGLNTNI